MAAVNQEVEIWRLPRVSKTTGFSKPTIYRKMKEGTFPRARKIGERGVGWLSTEILAWINSLEMA